jgi:hypothetical protein
VNIASGNTIAEVAALIGDMPVSARRRRAVTCSNWPRHSFSRWKNRAGRRYCRLASPEIAHALEALVAAVATGQSGILRSVKGLRPCARLAQCCSIDEKFGIFTTTIVCFRLDEFQEHQTGAT